MASHSMKLKIKTFDEERVIEIKIETTILEIKKVLCEEFHCDVTSLNLFMDGKELKDHQIIAFEGPKLESTVYAIIQETSSKSSTNSCDNALTTLLEKSATELSWAAIQRNMQDHLLKDPQLLEPLLQHPFIKSLLSSPSTLLKIAGPTLHQDSPLMKLLADPILLRKSLELSNSDALKEIMQSYAATFQEANVNLPELRPTLSTEPDCITAFRNFSSDLQQPISPPASKKAKKTETVVHKINSLEWFQQHAADYSQVLMAPYMHLMTESLECNEELRQEVIQGNPAISTATPAAGSDPNPYASMVADLDYSTILAVNSAYKKPAVVKAMNKINDGMKILNEECLEFMEHWQKQCTTGNGIGHLQKLQSDCLAKQPMDIKHVKEAASAQTQLIQHLVGLPHLFSRETSLHIVKPAKQRYAEQIEELCNYGFLDREKNFRALKSCFGDMKAAVLKLQNE